MAPEIKLLALDVDGTLVDETGTIRQRVRRALQDARERGIRIALCTGRPLVSVWQYWQMLDPDTPPVSFNGALVPSPAATGVPADDDDQGEPIVRMPLSPEVIPTLVEVARRRDYYLELHTEDTCYVERMGFEGERQSRKLGIEQVVGDFDRLWERETILKAQFVLIDDAARQQIQELQPEIEPSGRLSWGVSPGFSGHFCNIVDAQVDKEESMATLLRHLGIDWSQVFAAGDSPSDLGYVRRAAHGVIMANAPDEVRQQAPAIAPSVDEDGLAVVLERMILDDREAATS